MNLGEGATACFWLEPTGTYCVGLRRFTFREAGAHGHDASFITEIELPVEYEVRGDDPDGMRTQKAVPDESVPEHDDPRWPTACAECGEEITDDAEWQAYSAGGYVRSDSGETIWTRHVSGVEFAGALFDAVWLHEYERMWDGKKFVGPDGVALVAVCPDGHPWQVDGEATGGGYWTRTGDPHKPETLTVSPSIKVGDSYHGFLQNGAFTGHVG